MAYACTRVALGYHVVSVSNDGDGYPIYDQHFGFEPEPQSAHVFCFIQHSFRDTEIPF